MVNYRNIDAPSGGLLKEGTEEIGSLPGNIETPRPTSTQNRDCNGQMEIDSHLGAEGLSATAGQTQDSSA